MRIRLRFYGKLREIIGSREVEVEIPIGSTIGDLPKWLMELSGESIWDTFSGEVFPGDMRLLINGRDYFTLQGLDTILQDGDLVTVFPVIVGGSGSKSLILGQAVFQYTFQPNVPLGFKGIVMLPLKVERL